ncbi:putative MFS family arabinose efflux permease [Streptacidiphilus sp. BW17]|uniref:MFS transporter n=1 Tax=Streptacidiphilus sp. BW17 TaxID=3156274 RepID=UPI00351737F2
MISSPTDEPRDLGRDLGRDFRRLWTAYAVSAAGSAVGAGALPLVAVLALHVSTFQVSLLAALSALAGAAIALPLGSRIEYRTKRPVMMAADLVRCVALASVPVAAGLGVLTYAQLCVVGVVQAAAAIAFGVAGTAHLKGLVSSAGRLRAAAHFATTDWISQTAGPPLGGLLIGACGATVTMAVDAFSFLLSAVGVRAIRRPEPAPPTRPSQAEGKAAQRAELAAGWHAILRHPGLRPLFWNSLLFSGAVMMSSPLLAVLMLRDLHYTPWQYGLALGLPCLGGVLGSRFTTRLSWRLGPHRMLLLFGVVRAPWLLLLAWVPAGPFGLAFLVVVDTALLFAAGVFNPTFVAYRMSATRDDMLARVMTAWSVSTKAAQPLAIVLGGAVAAFADIRTAVAVAGVLCLASGLLLPWRQDQLAVAAGEEAEGTPLRAARSGTSG